MRERPNHTVAGLAFIAVCVVIALAIFAGTRAPGRSETVVENAVLGPDVVNLEAASRDEIAEPREGQTPYDLDEPGVIDCPYEECGVAREVSRQLVRQVGDARLIRLSILGGAKSGIKVDWEETPHDVFAFCSVRLPALIVQTNGGWQVDVLDQVAGPPTALATSQALYERACHPGVGDVLDRAAELGYHALSDDQSEVAIQKPEDMFNVIAAPSASGD